MLRLDFVYPEGWGEDDKQLAHMQLREFIGRTKGGEALALSLEENRDRLIGRVRAMRSTTTGRVEDAIEANGALDVLEWLLDQPLGCSEARIS